VRDATFGGVTVPAGHPTLLVTGSATRDERAYERPDSFDIDRVPGLALGFGFGIHTCLGAALARMESRVALTALTRTWPRLEVDEAECTRVRMSNVAGFASVPVHRPA
jgi:cytochrome P450